MSPVISRDFASVRSIKAELAGDPEKVALENAKPKSEGAEAPLNSVNAALQPTIKALKSLVRSNSEPSGIKKVVHVDPTADVEKGLRSPTPARPAPVQSQSRLNALLIPEKPLRPPPTYKTSFMNMLKYSWLNVLLVL